MSTSAASPTSATTAEAPLVISSSPLPPPQVPGALPLTPSAVAHEMKHMTSNTDLLTPTAGKDGRRPTKLATSSGHGSPSRHGTRSPNEIPSSPSSIHSSSSAIFERDIEPIPNSLFAPPPPVPGSESAHHHSPLATNLTLNHHNTNALMLESSVPAVLTSAATALASSTEDPSTSNHIAVIAPAIAQVSSTPQIPQPGLPATRPISIPVSSANSALGSRSPSPTRRTFSTASSAYATATSPERTASFGGTTSPGALGGPLPPGGFPGSSSRSPAISAAHTSPTHSPPSLSPLAATISLPPPSSDMYPPTPGVAAQNKRLSFISYNDLLSSAPVSSVPLSSIVSPATDEPPPHIPSVLGTNNGGAGGLLPTSPESVAEDIMPEWVGAGGEWEREGFGRGLEARLEDVLKQGAAAPSLQMTA